MEIKDVYMRIKQKLGVDRDDQIAENLGSPSKVFQVLKNGERCRMKLSLFIVRSIRSAWNTFSLVIKLMRKSMTTYGSRMRSFKQSST